jgi:hypothetical protein
LCFERSERHGYKNENVIETENGSRIPECFKNYNVRSFIDAATFQDIIENARENNANNNPIHYFADSITYYLENDDFKY